MDGNYTPADIRSSVTLSDKGVLENSHRSSVVGNEKGAMFTVDLKDKPIKEKPLPKRLQEYQTKQKTTTKEDILNKQKLAEERKKKYDEQRAKEARKVSEQAMQFDKFIRKHGLENAEDKPQRWFDRALPK